MRAKRVSIATLSVACGLATSAFGQVFYGTGVPAAINDATLTTVDIPVAGGPASINQVNVLLNITHTYEADLDILLVAPNGNYVHLSTDNGGGGDNFVNTRFTTCGSASITTGVAPLTGNWIPEGGPATNYSGTLPGGTALASLASLNGLSANGNWQLWVYDDAGADTGTVDSVALEFNGSLDPNGPAAPGGSNPTGVGVSNPTFAAPSASTLLTVTVSPGGCPLSTGITVAADLSSAGGSATQQFLDNGLNGDVAAGDGIYSFNFTIPANQGGGNRTFPFTIADAQARSGAGNIAFFVSAPPGVFTDLGTHNSVGELLTRDVTITAPTDIQWYKVVLPEANAGASSYVDIWTVSGGGNPLTDTEVGIYDNGGGLIANDDDSGVGLYTALSFGLGSGVMLGDAFNLGGDGIANGENGPLAAGTYWIAVGAFNMNFAGGFNAVSTYAGALTTTTLNIDIRPSNAPFAPSITAVSATPTPANSGQPVLLTATVVPGGNPASTGLVTRVDLSSIGGSATQQMFDNGTNGDVAAGDNIFSFNYTIPAATPEGTATVPMSVTDAQSRTGSRSLTFGIVTPPQWAELFNGLGDAADLPNTAQVVNGSGPLASIGGNTDSGADVDMFKIGICEPANFSATTINNTTAGDTQLFLFNSSGVGIAFSDDAEGIGGRSTITNSFTSSLAAGDYYLAFSRYNVDPVDSAAALIWANAPFDVERAPDGPGAANPVAAWTGAGGTGAYKILLTGACYAGGGASCVADVDDDGNFANGGHSDGAVTIDDLIFYLTAFENGATSADVDNGTFTGTTDGAVTIDDLLYFLFRFENGC